MGLWDQVVKIMGPTGSVATVTGGKLDVNATVAMGADATVDLNKVKGTATSVNNGTADAGCQRVAVASDNSEIPNKTANGSNIVEGALADATVAAGATGSISAKLRRLTTDLDALKTANHTDLTAATPAGTNTIGVTISPSQLGIVCNGTTPLTVSQVLANVAASQTDSSLVAANGSKVIYVLAVAMVTGLTQTNVTFNTKPAGAGTAISPLFANAISGGAVLPFNPGVWFKTNAGDGLTVTTGAGATTGILINYVQV